MSQAARTGDIGHHAWARAAATTFIWLADDLRAAA